MFKNINLCHFIVFIVIIIHLVTHFTLTQYLFIQIQILCVCLMFMNNKYYTNVFCCTFNQNIWNFLALSNINRDTRTRIMTHVFLFCVWIWSLCLWFLFYLLCTFCLSLVRCYRRWIDIWLGKMFQFTEQSTKIKN